MPTDLAHIERRSQIRLSLETADKKTAIRRYPLKLAEIEAGFDKLRAGLREQGRVSAALTTGKLELLGRREVEALVQRWWVDRDLLCRGADYDAVDPSEALHLIDQDLGALTRPHTHEPDPVLAMADQLLVQAGMAAYPHRIGSIQTKTRYPAVDRGPTNIATSASSSDGRCRWSWRWRETACSGGETRPMTRSSIPLGAPARSGRTWPMQPAA